jgi:hypothetical protein
VKDPLEQHGCGRRQKLKGINAAFVAMLFVTSGRTVKLIAMNLKLSGSLVERSITVCLDVIHAPLEQSFPKSQADVRPDRTFENYPELFAIVDASFIII